MKISNLKKYQKYLIKSNKKIVYLNELSKGVNLKQNIILDDLIYFEPLLKLSADTYNFKNILIKINDYLTKLEDKKNKINKTKRQSKKINESVMEYISSKLLLDTGFYNRIYKFNDEELKHLRYLINKEISNNKKKG